MDEQEQKRQHARQSLERYMHYWQRWAENDASRKKVELAVGLGVDHHARVHGFACGCAGFWFGGAMERHWGDFMEWQRVVAPALCVMIGCHPCKRGQYIQNPVLQPFQPFVPLASPLPASLLLLHAPRQVQNFLLPPMQRLFLLACFPTALQALRNVDKFRDEQQEVLSERTATPTSQLKFIVDGWMQARASWHQLPPVAAGTRPAAVGCRQLLPVAALLRRVLCCAGAHSAVPCSFDARGVRCCAVLFGQAAAWPLVCGASPGA